MKHCKYHGWQNTDNEACPYCIIDQLRKEIKELRKEVLDAGDAGARLINEARRTATDCADIVNFYHPNGKALEAIRKKFNL